jgi:hypothetical protein
VEIQAVAAGRHSPNEEIKLVVVGGDEAMMD